MLNKILQAEEKDIQIIDRKMSIFCKEEDQYFLIRNNIVIDFFVSQKQKIYLLNEDEKVTLNIHIIENGDVEVHFLSVTEKSQENIVNIYHENEKTKSNVFCHGVSYNKGNLTFIVNGYVSRGLKGCICNQESIIRTLQGGKGRIDPNLYIDEYDVIVNHSSYIGPFREEDFFYLETKGIKKSTSYILLLKAFLLGKIENKIYQKEIEKRLQHINVRGNEKDES